MNKEKIRDIQLAGEEIMFAVNDLWCLSAESNLKSTDYKTEELETIDRAIEAAAKLTRLLQSLKEQMQSDT